MARFVARRLGHTILVLLGVSVIAFVIIRLAPGDPARVLLPQGASDEQVQAMRERMGLTKPLVTQYLIYMNGVIRGDLGDSIFFRKSNAELIAESLWPTLLLSIAAMVIAIGISVPLGVAAALRKGSTVDLVAMTFALLGQAGSPVWVGILLIYTVSVSWHLLPSFGYGSLRHLILPSITLGIQFAALICRLTRAGMLDSLQEDYTLSARAQGLPGYKVTIRYVLKNALIPVVTVVGISLGQMLGGSMVTETIFNWPGIGRLTVAAVNARDFPLVQAIVLVVSAIFVFINLIVDIAYTCVDPRVRMD